VRSAFYQGFYDSGREAHLKAELEAAAADSLVMLPRLTNNLTALSNWIDGWNSVTKADLLAYSEKRRLESQDKNTKNIAQLKTLFGGQ
jgi:hypothetical protein